MANSCGSWWSYPHRSSTLCHRKIICRSSPKDRDSYNILIARTSKIWFGLWCWIINGLVRIDLYITERSNNWRRLSPWEKCTPNFLLLYGLRSKVAKLARETTTLLLAQRDEKIFRIKVKVQKTADEPQDGVDECLLTTFLWTNEPQVCLRFGKDLRTKLSGLGARWGGEKRQTDSWSSEVMSVGCVALFLCEYYNQPMVREHMKRKSIPVAWSCGEMSGRIYGFCVAKVILSSLIFRNFSHLPISVLFASVPTWSLTDLDTLFAYTHPSTERFISDDYK